MRADVNVSVRRPGAPFGTRTETKNVNSVRFIMAVVEHEARRQVDLIEEGGTVVQETRLYDPDRGETRSLRSKEDAHDYRYFPDPDLLPLELSEDFLAECRESLPELPDAKRARAGLEKHAPPAGAVTLSFGIAAYPAHGDSGEALIRAADAALYEAKRGGRDRFVIARGPERVKAARG